MKPCTHFEKTADAAMNFCPTRRGPRDAGKNLENIRGYSGRQPGDPVRAAAAIIAAVESANPPLRLLLGKAALSGARGKLDLLKKDFDAWEKTTLEADFPEGA